MHFIMYTVAEKKRFSKDKQTRTLQLLPFQRQHVQSIRSNSAWFRSSDYSVNKTSFPRSRQSKSWL